MEDIILKSKYSLEDLGADKEVELEPSIKGVV